MLPLIFEPQQLSEKLSAKNLIIIDLSNEQQYKAGHISGAIHINPAELVDGSPPAPGKLPSQQRLEQLFQQIGLTPESHVVAYDDEGGGWAGRLIWTLDVIGHSNHSYLNGGLWAWKQDNLPLTTNTAKPVSSDITIKPSSEFSINQDQIIDSLGGPNFLVWDARSIDEYAGQRQTAARNGHIPGAIHCEWTELMDKDRGLRIRQDALEYLAAKGITKEKEIVTHCHSHHRSGFTYLVGKSLGLNIKAYPGSWSEWGNSPQTPIE